VKQVRKMTPAILWRHAEATRAQLLPDRDAEDGDCQPVAEEVVRRLHRAGYPDAFVVLGDWEGHPHIWVRVGDLCVDATYDQFRYFVSDEEEEAMLDDPIRVWSEV